MQVGHGSDRLARYEVCDIFAIGNDGALRSRVAELAAECARWGPALHAATVDGTSRFAPTVL